MRPRAPTGERAFGLPLLSCPGGFFIRTHTPFHTGEQVKVRWTFQKVRGEYEAVMEVVWKREAGPLPGMGLKFLLVSDEAINILKQIVEKNAGL
jgi:Tfp pilus assembly protein PilZ